MKKNFFIYFVLLLAFFTIPEKITNISPKQTIEFINPVAENHYPDGIRFFIEVCGLPQDAEIVLKTKTYKNWDEYSWDEYDEIVNEGVTADGCETQSYHLKKDDLDSPPFSPVKYQWLVRGNAETILESDEHLHYYKNDSFEWVSQSSGIVTVWWHDRPGYFGSQLLSVAEQAVKDQASYFEFELNQPMTIVIFNTQSELGDWQELDEDFGGFAFPATSVTAQVIGQADDEWVNDVIPHEISHLYFYQIGKSQPWTSPWLNEGLAVYNEYSDHLSEWYVMQDAYEADVLVPFTQLGFTFNDFPDRREIDYAQSYYAILFMEETYGHEKVLHLMDAYRQGANLDSSLKKAFGVTISGFEIEYKEWLSQRLKTPPPDTSIIIEPVLDESDTTQMGGVVLVLTGVMCLFAGGAVAGVVVFAFLISIRSKNQSM